MLQRIKKNWQWIILFLSILIVVYLAMNVLRGEIIQVDTFFNNIIVKKLRNNYLTPIMKFFTMFGSAYMIIIITLLSALIIKNRKRSLFITLNLLMVFISSQLLKIVVRRERPIGYNLIIEKGFSFPSGHSMVSTAFYGFLIYLIYKYCKNKKLKYILITSLSILIILIGISRIYLGVHYFSDVIAGFFTSIAYLILYIKLIERYMTEDI